jgi:hypothetical protein
MIFEPAGYGDRPPIGPVRGTYWPLVAILLGVHNGLRYIYDRMDGLRARRLCGKGRDHEH